MIVPLTCTLTGLTFGSINLDPIPGRQPYCTAFRETILLHPIFSLPLPATVALLRNSLERHLEGKEVDDTLELSFLASLRGMHCLQIPEIHNPILPSRKNVLSNGHKLIAITRWHLSRPSFKFPKLVLSPINTNERLENIQDYLSLLVDLTVSADRKRESYDEEERAEIQARAVASIRRPEKIAKKSLWRWCENHILHSPFKPEAERLKTLFHATSKDVTRLDRDDLEFLLTTLESILPLGTPLLTEVRKHCEGLLNQWENHFKAFYIVDTVAEMWAKLPEDKPIWIEPEQVSESKELGPQPIEQDYPTRTSFIIAMAKWKLSNKS